MRLSAYQSGPKIHGYNRGQIYFLCIHEWGLKVMPKKGSKIILNEDCLEGQYSFRHILFIKSPILFVYSCCLLYAGLQKDNVTHSKWQHTVKQNTVKLQTIMSTQNIVDSRKTLDKPEKASEQEKCNWNKEL
jgi:hypothetical protein